MEFSVESWSPEYGVSADETQLDEGSGPVDIDVELPADAWAPISPETSDAPGSVVFVDGVRRIDARVWIHQDGLARPGVCASVAAGAVRCEGTRAELIAVSVRRGLFTGASTDAAPITTVHGTYEPQPAADDSPEALYLAIHDQMTALERRLDLGSSAGADLVVFDGPLRGRDHPAGVGYVKTQAVQYLPDPQQRLLGVIAAGQRTPVFCIGGGFTRWSWYQRLPGPISQPLSGIVRCELDGHGSGADAIVRANAVAATLGRFASEPHKDARAPQNLYPIAGLEHRLRHLLGDPIVLDRALRRASSQALS